MIEQSEEVCAGGVDVEYLPLYYSHLTPQLIQQAKEELHEDSDKTKRTLIELRTLIRDSDNDNMEYATDNEELMPFLRARKFDVKRAYSMYKKYFSQFSTYDKLFKDFDFSDIIKLSEANCIGFLPRRDVEGCIVAVLLHEHWDTSQFSAADLLRAMAIALMVYIPCPIAQITGIKFIINHKGHSLSQVLGIRSWHLKYTAEILQTSTPLRFKGFHIVNNNRFTFYLWQFVKPLLSRKITERTHFHGSDIETFHQFFSPSILPSELGGTMGPFSNDAESLRILAQSENFITARINKFNSKE